MYLITYEKTNGTVFCRIRNTMPDCGLNHYTSMGWKVIDIKYRFKDNYYELPKYNQIKEKYYKKNHLIKNLQSLCKKNATILILATIIIVFLIK